MPASGRFLLDTNIVIALLEGDDAMLSNLDQASEIFIPATAVGELFFGAAKSGRSAENIAKVEAFVTGRSILSSDLHIAREYGSLRQRLPQQAHPIPHTDLPTPATTNNHRHTLFP